MLPHLDDWILHYAASALLWIPWECTFPFSYFSSTGYFTYKSPECNNDRNSWVMRKKGWVSEQQQDTSKCSSFRFSLGKHPIIKVLIHRACTFQGLNFEFSVCSELLFTKSMGLLNTQGSANLGSKFLKLARNIKGKLGLCQDVKECPLFSWTTDDFPTLWRAQLLSRDA